MKVYVAKPMSQLKNNMAWASMANAYYWVKFFFLKENLLNLNKYNQN